MKNFNRHDRSGSAAKIARSENFRQNLATAARKAENSSLSYVFTAERINDSIVWSDVSNVMAEARGPPALPYLIAEVFPKNEIGSLFASLNHEHLAGIDSSKIINTEEGQEHYRPILAYATTPAQFGQGQLCLVQSQVDEPIFDESTGLLQQFLDNAKTATAKHEFNLDLASRLSVPGFIDTTLMTYRLRDDNIADCRTVN